LSPGIAARTALLFMGSSDAICRCPPFVVERADLALIEETVHAALEAVREDAGVRASLVRA
jgi:hypothetical protein